MFAQGNEALRNGDYGKAITRYAQVLVQKTEMPKYLPANLSIARQKYRLSRQLVNGNVGVCGWDLAHNAAGRVYTLATLYETFTNVEIIGSIFPCHGRDIWEPIRDTPIAKHIFIVEDESKFVEQALQLVSEHPYDVVHLSKSRIPNIIFGILYKLLWNSKVFMDIDDEELAFVGGDTAISIEDYLKINGNLPRLQNLFGKDWTRIAVGLAKEFDGVTVCNRALQSSYGGEIIRHARDEKRFKPSPELKRKSRAQYGIPQDHKVVLFFGTPREYKGLIETAQAIAELNSYKIIFFIVGTFPDPTFKQRLLELNGCNYKFLPNQPFSETQAILATADCCVLLQDTNSLAAQYQTPAKLSDALGMGVTVLASPTRGLEEYFNHKALTEVSPHDLKEKIENVLKSRERARINHGIITFDNLLSITVCAKTLKLVSRQAADVKKRRAVLKTGYLLFSKLNFDHKLPNVLGAINLICKSSLKFPG